MVSRASSRRWFLRDLPQTVTVLVWAAFVVSILIYFVDWSAVRHETVARRQLNNGKNGNSERYYTGSIIVPTHGKFCWEAVFDNRTGSMIDKGNVNCDDAAHQLAEKNSPEGMDATRLRAVGKAFRHEGN